MHPYWNSEFCNGNSVSQAIIISPTAASDHVKESISCLKRKESVKLVHNAVWILNEVKQGTQTHTIISK